MSGAAAKQISVDDEVVSVLSEPDGFFTVKVEQRSALKAFLCVFTLLSAGKSLVINTTAHRTSAWCGEEVSRWLNWQ